MEKSRKGFTAKILGSIERFVNFLPDPVILFALLALIVIILSSILSAAGVSVVHPGTGKVITVKNLLNAEGLRYMLTTAVPNFIEFPPLGIVLAAIIGIGVADRSGFLAAALKSSVLMVPKKLVVPALVFASVNASIIADAGIVVLPPLGALLFMSMNRHPIAGLSAAFVGVVGGFSANLMITALDPLLAGFTQSAAQMIDKSYIVYPTANYYFMLASVIPVTIICTFVTTKIVEPNLGPWNKEKYNGGSGDIIHETTPTERKALRAASFTFIALIAVTLFAIFPANGFLRDDSGSLIPFYRSIISIIIIIFLFSGIVYGVVAKKIRSTKDLAKMLAESMSTMGAYIVLAFVAGQFIAYFGRSNLGIITAVKGAEFLKGIGLEGISLVIGFLIFSLIINMFIASASAKWAVLSAVFVPMLMLMGYSPETTQLIYRVGDSTTNMITPLLPYFPVIMAFARKYDPDITFGRLLSILTPYSFALFIIWGIFLVLWIMLKIPLGPDVPIFYHQ